MSGNKKSAPEGAQAPAPESPVEGAQARRAVRKFSQWKTYVIAKLSSLRFRATKQNVKVFIDGLIYRLQYARTRDLVTILSKLHQLATEVPEVRELIPSPEEVSKWFGEGE